MRIIHLDYQFKRPWSFTIEPCSCGRCGLNSEILYLDGREYWTLRHDILVFLDMMTGTLCPNSRYMYKDRKLWGWRVELRA